MQQADAARSRPTLVSLYGGHRQGLPRLLSCDRQLSGRIPSRATAPRLFSTASTEHDSGGEKISSHGR